MSWLAIAALAVQLCFSSADPCASIVEDPLGKPGRRVDSQRGGEVWVKPLANGEYAVAIFNRGDQPLAVNVIWKDHLGFIGSPRVRDVWNRRDEGPVHGGFAKRLEPHACALYRVTPPRRTASKK